MGYADDDCRNRFSPDQGAAMENYLLTNRADLITSEFPSTQSIEQVEPLEPANEEIHLFPNNTLIRWTDAPGASSYHLQIALNPAFTALIKEVVVMDSYYIADDLEFEKTYRWRVKPLSQGNTCAPYSNAQKFTTGTLLSGIEENDQVESFSLYPNPLRAYENIQIELSAKQTFEAATSIIDITGKVVFETSHLFLEGYNSKDISSNLPSGFYILAIKAEDLNVSQKFIVE
jgi:hypothetical protein